MKVKLDDYYVRVLINGLFQQRKDYDAETNAAIDAILLRLVDISDGMKGTRKKKVPFAPEEVRLIRYCLMEWRNREVQAGKQTAVEVISELLVLFV